MIKEKISNFFGFFYQRGIILVKKIRNRTPDGLKDFTAKFLLPYSGIIVIATIVLVSNFAHASETTYVLESNEEVMDLDPVEVANVVGVVNPYTPNYEEDSVQVALAMKDTAYLGKPVITETAKTEIPQEGERKSTIVYTVEGGDTLSSIGWKYGLTIATIKAVNILSSDAIKPGQQLKLPPQDLSPSYIAQLAAQKKVAGAQFNPAGGNGMFRRPTAGWSMSQTYGPTNFERFHTGIDLDSRSGTTIYAAATGRVARAVRGWGSGYGNYIIIDHGNGWSTLYGHLSSFAVGSGQAVQAGQMIGIMGSTGWSTGVHLHFEIRKNGSPVNPLNYL